MTTEKMIRMIGLMTVLFICACSKSYDESKNKRLKTAEETQDTIIIGVAWADKQANFVKGAQLAVKEFNDNGGVFGKPLELLINEGEKKISNKLTLRQKQDITVEVARAFAANPRVVAVTGHRSSYQAIPASIVYQFHGIAFIAPTSTNLNLTDHNFNYVFRMTPNNEKIAEQLAKYCHQKAYKKIVILHTKSSYGEQLADSFVSSLVEKVNITQQSKIVLRRSFFPSQTDFSHLMVELKAVKKKADFDAIFIATGAKMGAQIYQESRDMGFKVPFIGAEGLDNLTFWEAIKEWEIAEKVFTQKSVVPTLFKTSKHKSQVFIKNFEKEYEHDPQTKPDRYAALGYDSIKILVHGIKKAKSIQPFKIAETLRYMPPCRAVTGQYKFKMDGDVETRKFHFKYFREGLFEYEKFDFKDLILAQEDCGDVDRDKDGIPNDIDACPDNKKEEISKGVYEKGVSKGCPIDSDEDTYEDYRDHCPNTRPNELKNGLDSYGCPVDYDKDGVPDYRDDCPKHGRFDTRKGVDSYGCLNDADKDEIPDYQDVCPQNTLKELAKGIYQQGDQIGCPIDSDNDEVPDYRDDCPQNLLNEMEKGLDLRGCPFDRDKDQVPDYLDDCPKNKHFEIGKGVDSQGCPLDTDQDSVPDYKDACFENSPEEMAKGVFQQGTHLGCPIESDQDGVPDYRDDCLNNTLLEIGKGVDSRGCPQDTDQDAVPDYKDVCFKNSPQEIAKGVNQQGIRLGCPMDNDNDGVPDYRDNCPNNKRFEIRKGVNSDGCPKV